MALFRVIFLYLIFTSNVFAIPEVISLCLWNAEIASALQHGRQYEKEKDLLYHRNSVKQILTNDGRPRWFVLKVLEVFDYVWKEFTIKSKPSDIFKLTYNKCITNYKNQADIYY